MSDQASEILNLVVTQLQPIETLYLNEDRIHEHFTTQLGAIASLAVAVDGQIGGSLDFKFFSVSKQKTVGQQISYDIQNPLTRALVLRAALELQGAIKPPSKASDGQYVVGSGVMCVSSPEFVAPARPDCVDTSDPRMIALERERAAAEAVRLGLGGPQPVWERMWLLALVEGPEIRLASPLDTHWIKYAISSYALGPYKGSVFGVLRHAIEGVPVVSAIHTWVDLGTAV